MKAPVRTSSSTHLGAAFLSLTMLALASCGGGGSKSSDALGTGGVTGGGAGGAGGVGSGSPGTGGSPSGGGAGGGAGSYGGGGGTGGAAPSPCMDPSFPVSCPMHDGVPASCWSIGTECSTIAKCGDQFRSCTSANAHYDCTEMRCVYNSSTGDGGTECGDPSYPVACPAIGEVPKLCWSSGTICSTLTRCGTEFKSCLSAGYHFSCTEQRCVADTGGAPDGGPPAADASAGVIDAAPASGDAAGADTAAADASAAADTHD
jgi:hypothetical protein